MPMEHGDRAGQTETDAWKKLDNQKYNAFGNAFFIKHDICRGIRVFFSNWSTDDLLVKAFYHQALFLTQSGLSFFCLSIQLSNSF